MGCCEGKRSEYLSNALLSDMKISIIGSELNKFCRTLRSGSVIKKQQIDVNECMIKCNNNAELTVPAFAILCGSCNILKYLMENFQVSLEKAEKSLSNYGFNALGVICSKGYIEMLEYYLPLSLSIDSSIYLNPLYNKTQPKQTPQSKIRSYSPIHLASFHGHIGCVKTIFQFFQDEEPPCWLNVNYQDINTGENCALLACKSANFPMIRYLHSNCAADFHVLNSHYENALQVFLSTCKKFKIHDALTIVRYLVEVIHVDPTYEFENTLRLCDDEEITEYLDDIYKQRGLEYNKKLLENRYNLVFQTEASESKESFIMDISFINEFNESRLSSFDSFIYKLEVKDISVIS